MDTPEIHLNLFLRNTNWLCWYILKDWMRWQFSDKNACIYTIVVHSRLSIENDAVSVEMELIIMICVET